MFKSIFSRLVAVFIAVLIVGFSITAVMLYYFLDNFATREKVDVLSRSAEVINQYIGIVYENLDNSYVAASLEYTIQNFSSNTNSFIMIIDPTGKIATYKPSSPEILKLLEGLEDETGQLRLKDKNQYNKVMLTDEIVKEKGNFYGLFKGSGVDWLTIEKRLKYKDHVVGAVYLHTPIPEVNRLRTSVFRLFQFAVTISILISIVLVYIFSLRISKPLKEINNAARIIAGGEFQKRLSIRSRDEIGELANSFNHMVAALQNLEEMRRGFIANVSHELRTPMTSIRGFIEGILDGTIPSERHQYYLTIVRDETTRLNRLVNDLLDLAKMEAGEMSFQLKDFDINELIRRCIIKLETQITAKDLQVEADFEEEEMLVKADADAIERVIINLMHNAIKFTPEAGKIKVSTSKHKEKVYISVADNGIGIEKEEIDAIWERFHKSDKSRSQDKTGTGLGLAIVKNIINEHSQNIWVESELGKGTEFTFTLNKGSGNEAHS
ncbi:MAG: cell wall metabolism sensor histidine kinase WalK [Clostridia bacterium]|nr:cell wall metabolism sensor histidine kinase WalK [Clostridia bacterium]